MLPANVTCVQEFYKDLDKLKRIGLEKDLEVFKQAVAVEPMCLNGIVRLRGIGEEFYPVYKARKFRCRALNRGSQSGVRVIYTFNPIINEVVLIEIYYHEDHDNNDMVRAKKYAIPKNISK